MLGLARRKMTARVLFCVKKNPPKKGGGEMSLSQGVQIRGLARREGYRV